MSNTTSQFDVARYLSDENAIANYLDDCLEEGGSRLFLAAIGDVARARGMSEIAASAGMTRASLYKSLGEEGNPAFTTMERVLDSLGLRIAIVAKAASESPQPRAKVPKSFQYRVADVVTQHAQSATKRKLAASLGAKKIAAKKPSATDAKKKPSTWPAIRERTGSKGSSTREGNASKKGFV